MDSPDRSVRRRRRWKAIAWRALPLAVGIALLVELLGEYSLAKIRHDLARAGWGILAVTLFHVVSLVLQTLGWRVLFSPNVRPGLLRLLRDRWIGQSVNNLLPAGQAAGHAVRARLATIGGAPLAESAATTLVDFTLNLLAQILVAVVAVALLLLRIGLGAWGRRLLICVASVALLAAVLVWMQLLGKLKSVGDGIARALRNVASIQSRRVAASAEEIDKCTRELYRRPRTLAAAALFQLLAWGAEVVEIQLALHFLGLAADFDRALILHGLTMSVRSLVFFIPAGVGAQEGTFVLIGRFVGMAANTALALGLIRRAREVLLGIPGLIVWRFLEARHDKDNARA